MPIASQNELNVAIGTTADNSGLDSAKTATSGYTSQIEIATQKVREAAAAEGIKESAIAAASNEVVKASTATENYAAKIYVATQRAAEFEKAGRANSTAALSNNNTLTSLNQKFGESVQATDKAVQAQLRGSQATEEASTSTKNLTGAIVGAQIIYQALITTLQRVEQVFSSSITAANAYEQALGGLNSTAHGMGDNADAATQAAQRLSADGLIPVTQSISALRNLLASGFSVPQATQMLDALKDKLAFNRQGYGTMGDAVIHATKAIELGNTRGLEATGINEKMNAMLKEAGVNTSNLGDLQISAAARQAILNGVVKNAAANHGDAAKAANTFAAEQQQAATAVQNLKIQLGGIEQVVAGPLIKAFGNFINTHQKLIIDFGLAAVAAVAVTAAVIGLGIAIEAVSSFLIAADPLMLAFVAVGVALGLVLGDVVYHAVDKLHGKFQDYLKSLQGAGDSTNTLTDQTGQLTKAQQNLQDKLSQIDEQIAKNNRDFGESLAKAIQGIQDKVASLNEQLAQENDSFAQSQAKKLDQFNKTEQSMNDAHDKRVDTLQKNIDHEQALGKWADQQKLADLQQQLKDENDQYNQQAADKQATYNQDIADAKKAHDEKLADLQKQLDDENALLKKHAADVAAVQNVTMLDTIDKIKQSHDDQIAAFADQKTQAVKSAGETAQGIITSFNNQGPNMTTSGSNLATDFITGLNGKSGDMTTTGNTLAGAFARGFTGEAGKKFGQFSEGFVNFFENIPSFLGQSTGNAFDAMKTHKNTKTLNDIWDQTMKKTMGQAKGGPVQAGQPYLVGDNPDGSINSTTEMFVPSQSGTIIPAGQTRSLLGGAGGGKGVTIYQTNNNYSQFDMDAANRELGWRLVNA